MHPSHRVAAGAAALLALSGLSACGPSMTQASAASEETSSSSASETTDSIDSQIAIEPAPGSTDVPTDTSVVVRAPNATLTEVSVLDEDGRSTGGVLSADGHTWRAAVPVRVGTRYRVQARAEGFGGIPIERSGTFATTSVKRRGTVQIASVRPRDGAKVGVAHPLVVAFDSDVANRAIVQSALRVDTNPPVAGAWYWVDDRRVHYRPKDYWPAGTRVTLRARIAQRDAGDGVIGGKNRTSRFEIGRHQVIEVDTDAKRLKVLREDRAVKTFKVSTGKPGWRTRNGIKVMLDKVGYKVWTDEAIGAPENYREESAYAIRLTSSGEFVHDASWNRANMGRRNTSHGCIGLRTEDMRWVFRHSLIGDPVVVTGSPRKPAALTNGYSDWNVSWKKWRRGNA